MVVVLDTVKEITTVTVQQNEVGDTLRMITITDRTRASTRDRYHDVQEKILVKTDTVYVEKQSESSNVAVVGSSTEVLPDGSVRQKGVILKWIFWILLILTVLILVVRIFVFRR